MLRNIPALALIPLVILWFGIDETAKLFLIAVSVFFPLYLNTFHGIRNVDPGLVEMARTYGLSRWQLYRQVILPGALSSILVGLRFSLGLMWVILIVAETISAQAGIGYLTMNAREFLQTDVVLVGILLYAVLGKLADLFARGLERWWLRWHPKRFGAREVLRDTQLAVEPGQFIAIVGRSGCGKSTLLRLLAGSNSRAPASMLARRPRRAWACAMTPASCSRTRACCPGAA
jgi:ABC-type multidrug transport system fused ATPase/permease subunit